MKIFKLLVDDFKIGIWKKWRFIILGIVVWLRCTEFREMAMYYKEDKGTAVLSLADCIATVFKGDYPLIRMVELDSFPIHIGWFVLILLILMMPLDHIWRSMDLWGVQYNARISKRQWWIEKCLYVLGVNLISFIICILVMGLYVILNGYELSMNNNPEYYWGLFGEVASRFDQSLSVLQNGILLVGVPFLGIAVLSMMQLLVTVWIHPVIAYLVSVILLFLSVYADYFLLPGNYMMAIRSSYIDPEGISAKSAIGFGSFMIGLIMMIGFIFIKKKEIFRTKRITA